MPAGACRIFAGSRLAPVRIFIILLHLEVFKLNGDKRQQCRRNGFENDSSL